MSRRVLRKTSHKSIDELMRLVIKFSRSRGVVCAVTLAAATGFNLLLVKYYYIILFSVGDRHSKWLLDKLKIPICKYTKYYLHIPLIILIIHALMAMNAECPSRNDILDALKAKWMVS